MSNLYTLITGASEGFGRALAIECASRKMNLILVALPESSLHFLADDINERYNIDVVAIEKDLSVEENCISLFKEVEQLNLPVNMLINNVGMGSTMFFNEGNLSFYQKQMKSYVYFFSKSLRRELMSENINVSVICPGPMNTNVSVTAMNVENNWVTRMSTMEPEEVAPIAISGLLKRKEVIIPGMINKMLLVLDKLVPSIIKTIITNSQMKNMSSKTTIDIKQKPVSIPPPTINYYR